MKYLSAANGLEAAADARDVRCVARRMVVKMPEGFADELSTSGRTGLVDGHHYEWTGRTRPLPLGYFRVTSQKRV
jgi:hypothetical protein